MSMVVGEVEGGNGLFDTSRRGSVYFLRHLLNALEVAWKPKLLQKMDWDMDKIKKRLCDFGLW